MFFAPTVRTRSYSPRAFDHRLERFFDDALAFAPQRSFQLEQDEKSWTLSLDVPGLSREDLTIGIEGAVVRVDSKADAKRQYKAAYELPLEIDATASEAKLENGVLTLKLAKKLPESKVAQLAIN
ncbi:Hsp20/alpha crystallin family protein [Variovorax sp. LARHSF232]